MLDSRKSIRCRTFLTGRLGIEKLPLWNLGCTIRNVSEGGACIASGDVPRRARLVWARDGRAGLAMDEADGPAPTAWSGSGRQTPTTDAERLQDRIAWLAKHPCRRGPGA